VTDWGRVLLQISPRWILRLCDMDWSQREGGGVRERGERESWEKSRVSEMSVRNLYYWTLISKRLKCVVMFNV
jgi:hypothetical protein